MLPRTLRDAFAPPHFPLSSLQGLEHFWVGKKVVWACAHLVVGPGREFKHLLSWDSKLSPHQNSHRSAGNPMHHALCNIFFAITHSCRTANDLHMPVKCKVETGSIGHVIWNCGWGSVMPPLAKQRSLDSCYDFRQNLRGCHFGMNIQTIHRWGEGD